MWKLVPVLVSFLFALILVPASLPLLLPTPIMLLVPVLLPSLDAWPLVSASLVLLAAVALLLVWALSALVLASLVLVVPVSLVVPASLVVSASLVVLLAAVALLLVLASLVVPASLVVLLAAVVLLLVWALSALVLASLVLLVPASLVVLLAAVVLLLVPAPAAVAVAWSYGSPMRPPGRAVTCGQSASDLRADCHQNLGDDLVDELQIRPPNANHLPARPLKVSLATLLGLDRIVYLADGLPVLDAAIKFDRDLQCRQRNINEVRAAIDTDFLLCRQPGDPRAQ